MTHEPQLEVRTAQPYAAIAAIVTMDGIGGAVDQGFPELFGWLGANAIAPSGPPFIRYLVIDMAADLEIELGVPVASPIAGDGRIKPGEIPQGTYVVLRHTGHYDGLIDANAALQDWAREHGINFDASDAAKGSTWGGRFEHYLTDPSREPDPAKWETDVAYLTREP